MKIVMLRRAVAFGIRRVGLVMIIEREDVILLIHPGKHVERVTVVALGQLVEEPETFRQFVILARAEIQSQPGGESEKFLAPLARGNHIVDRRRNHHDEGNQRNDENPATNHTDSLLAEGARDGYYNSGSLLHARRHLSPFPIQSCASCSRRATAQRR